MPLFFILEEMTMGMTRARKQEEIEELKGRMEGSEIIVLTHNTGLDAKSITDLRLEMRKNEVGFKVVKNTLAKLASKGTSAEKIADMFAGPIGMATSQDPVAAAKVAHNFAKKNEKAGYRWFDLGEGTCIKSDKKF